MNIQEPNSSRDPISLLVDEVEKHTVRWSWLVCIFTFGLYYAYHSYQLHEKLSELDFRVLTVEKTNPAYNIGVMTLQSHGKEPTAKILESIFQNASLNEVSMKENFITWFYERDFIDFCDDIGALAAAQIEAFKESFSKSQEGL